MKPGLSIFPTAETPSPSDLARMAEERGFESLLFPDHTHITARPTTPHPSGDEIPREYARILEPLVAAAAAACATSELIIGTAVCLLPQRDPILTAKQVASIDHLSGGRFLFGVGAGWNLEEMVNHGVDPSRRFLLLRERIEAMTTIWTRDVATYRGETVSFEDVCSWPKPVSTPRPPVILGGNGPSAVARAIQFADGWMPNMMSEEDELLGRVEDLLARAQRPMQVVMMSAPARAERLERMRDAGVQRCVFYLPSSDRQSIERRLEHIEAAIAELG
jgi:probable F420-dependent oxidoreductase